MKEIRIRAIKSKIITSGSHLIESLHCALKSQILNEGDILAITSKVVAITQGRVRRITNEKELSNLVKEEADEVLGGKKVVLTLKEGIFTPWAGIDRSNTKKGTVVLWPLDPFESAWEIRDWLKKAYKLQKVGVIIVDSFCAPMRKGVVGIALGYAGFEGVNDKRGTRDIYGNILKVTQEAVADSLATMANLAMGQGKEQTPFAVIQGAPVRFISKKSHPSELLMSEKECLYGPLYRKKNH
jgi:coenzyme F420-0:L-glutamate ligase